MEKQRGMAFVLRKTATAVKKKKRIDRNRPVGKSHVSEGSKPLVLFRKPFFLTFISSVMHV
jgi:hypothetical protein